MPVRERGRTSLQSPNPFATESLRVANLGGSEKPKPKEVFHRAMVRGPDEADERASGVEWELCDWRTTCCFHGKHQQLWEAARYVHVTESDGCIVVELQTPDGI